MKQSDLEERRFERLVHSWQTAATKLSFRIEAPFFLGGPDLKNQCVAYLPDFGGPRGMVIGKISPPDYRSQNGIAKYAKANQVYISHINIEIYESYSDGEYKNVLLDWGYFGDESSRPEWMKI